MTFPRRSVLLSVASLACRHEQKIRGIEQEGHERFRLAICNEIFRGWDFARSCRGAIQAGYSGIEIAPYTLSEDPAALPSAQRRQIRQIMLTAGIEYVGLHSLLTAPRGQLHITTPDHRVRQRSWNYFRRLLDLAADLGPEPIMVLGSARQRRTVGGSTAADATERLVEGLAAMASQAQQRGVLILIEPLAPNLCDVVNTAAEAVALVRRIGSPAVQTMFDTHNAAAETLAHDEVLRKYASYIRHVHLNEMDGRAPGMASYDFSRILRALYQLGYRRWLSVEVFHFEPSGEEIARRAARYLRQVEAQLIRDGDEQRPVPGTRAFQQSKPMDSKEDSG